MIKFLFLTFTIFINIGFSNEFPPQWWAPVSRESAPSWEVLPQDAEAGEVILSKRTELGVFSNLAKSSFIFEGKHYNSIEGFWQMMKFPENDHDERSRFPYNYSRNYVSAMWGFDAKNAGNHANKIMGEFDIEWVSYNGIRFNYKDFDEGSDFHYQLIYQAIRAKILQNYRLKELLGKTKNLILRPDHYQGVKPESYYYHKILMKIRSELFNVTP